MTVPVAPVAIADDTLPPLPPLTDTYEGACTFSSFANWIVPGRVLLGRFPFVDSVFYKCVADTDDVMLKIVEAGVTTFVSLLSETPHVRQMPINGVRGFFPYHGAAYTQLANTPHHRTRGLDFVHAPLADREAPEEDAMAGFLADLCARMARGESLYIHCWGGKGRAGMVGAALLVQLYGVGAEEALERVQRAFNTRGATVGKSPETEAQLGYVRGLCHAAQCGEC